ncbi:hypothetical protein [Phytomonospora endophytica]|uniref:Uncharacterized protein n=1 Tax=Phytomonospora endophytica TaxID=714109 RepID=A0A841G030_9ACTN|nr:hypothetical protein [Phytomonospora endophytica]MBB6039007.1 hypothetical protein [Phytomonospora endophytica]
MTRRVIGTAGLWEKAEELGSAALERCAIGLGLAPPEEPAGYPWKVVVSHPDVSTEPERKVPA